MPYSVSLFECEWPSMNRKICAQNAAARSVSIQPAGETGLDRMPIGLNQRIPVSSRESPV